MAGDLDGAEVCDEIRPKTETAASTPPASTLAIGPMRVEFMGDGPFLKVQGGA